MSTPETDPLWYLSFDSLLQIVFDRKLWPLFQNYLTTKTLLRAKFDEIRPIRNRIAHSRLLHKDDLGRINGILRDLDHGIWKFCTSYNAERGFIAHSRKDTVYQRFADRERVGYVEVEPGKWVLLGNTVGADLHIMMHYSIRPSSRRRVASRVSGIKGAIYDFTFSLTREAGHLDYPRILAATKSIHDRVLHIFIDSFQKQLRVTFPALLDANMLIAAIDEFYDVCLRRQTSILLRNPQKEGSQEKDSWGEYEESMRPFEQIAADWPHYVVPPSHPFSFLCPDMPCKILERV
jgi:hypothetical protein